jgi:imidazole glycerol-phosphate synthase subunit HisF
MIRIIPKLDIKNENLVKGIHLEGLRALGDPEYFAEQYYLSGADEIIYHDVVASLYERNSMLPLIKKTSKKTFVPLIVGGGIKNLKQIEKILKSGADRVFINTAAINNNNFIKKVIEEFGASTLVISIEVVKKNKNFYCRKDFGREETNLELIEWCKKLQNIGVVELIITSIDKDGTGEGFDLNIAEKLEQYVNINYILNGGFSKTKHFFDILNICKPSGFAIGSALHYSILKHKIREKKQDGNFEFLKTKKKFKNFSKITIRDIKNYLTKKKSIQFRNL